MTQEEVNDRYYRGHHKGVFFWIRNSRAIALPQSALPALLAIVMCIGMEGFTWWIAVLAFFGVCIGHLGMNLADDYFDYRRDSRIRSTLSKTSIRARMDKCTYINTGDATIDDLRRAVIVFLGIAGGLGVLCVAGQWWLHGWQAALWVAMYALLGLAVGVNYSGGVLKLAMHGLGELVIGLMFGPLLMLGMEAAVCGTGFTWCMAVMSVAIGMLVTNIVYVHSVMETEADGELDKMTFARLLKNRTAQLVFVAVFALIPYALLVAGAAAGWWSWWSLLTLLTLPMSVYLIYSLTRFVNGLPTNDNPRWWMGPMTEFDIFKEAGMDWFLIRWLLARNVVMYWCLILIIVEIISLCG